MARELSRERVDIAIASRNKDSLEASASELATETPGKIIDASEIAYIVAFLASPKSIVINGDVIPAGGGAGNSIYC